MTTEMECSSLQFGSEAPLGRPTPSATERGHERGPPSVVASVAEAGAAQQTTTTGLFQTGFRDANGRSKFSTHATNLCAENFFLRN